MARTQQLTLPDTETAPVGRSGPRCDEAARIDPKPDSQQDGFPVDSVTRKTALHTCGRCGNLCGEGKCGWCGKRGKQ